jgi:hypothetical protein
MPIPWDLSTLPVGAHELIRPDDFLGIWPTGGLDHPVDCRRRPSQIVVEIQQRRTTSRGRAKTPKKSADAAFFGFTSTSRHHILPQV